MTNKDVLIANLLAGVGVFVAIFIASIWGVSPMGIIFVGVIALIAYWRLRVFPRTGLLLLRYMFVWGTIYSVAGVLSGILLAFVCGTYFHMQMHHGLAFVIVGGGFFLGLSVGVIVGYLKHKHVAVVSREEKI